MRWHCVDLPTNANTRPHSTGPTCQYANYTANACVSSPTATPSPIACFLTPPPVFIYRRCPSGVFHSVDPVELRIPRPLRASLSGEISTLLPSRDGPGNGVLSIPSEISGSNFRCRPLIKIGDWCFGVSNRAHGAWDGCVRLACDIGPNL